MFQLVESLQFGAAHRLAAGLVAFAFLVVLSMLLLERRRREQAAMNDAAPVLEATLQAGLATSASTRPSPCRSSA